MSTSTLGAGELTPRMMVLGLVVQEEDTVAGVARRLKDQFARARFPRSSAYKNLPSLADEGLVHLVEKGPPGKPSLDRYRSTSEGVELLRGWLCYLEPPPVVRDVLQCKLEFLTHDDLAAFVRIIREEEEAYTAVFDIALSRVRREQVSRRARGGKAVDWHARLASIKTRDEAKLWGLMSQRLEHLREELEELLEERARGSFGDG